MRTPLVGLLAACALFAASLWSAPSDAKPKGYRAHVARWHHKDAGDTAPLDEAGRPKLALEAINVKERVELQALSDDGGFSEADQERARLLLRDTRTDQMGTLDARLLDLLYRIQRHFDAPCVRVISAYRAPSRGRSSQHTRGAAVDIVVPGVKDAKLAAFVRSLERTGVGLYPTSGFVHVDVRERSHHWVDYSGPGRRKATLKKKQRKKSKRTAAKKPPRRRGTRGGDKGG